MLNLYDLKQTFIFNLYYDPNIMNPNIIYLIIILFRRVNVLNFRYRIKESHDLNIYVLPEYLRKTRNKVNAFF